MAHAKINKYASVYKMTNEDPHKRKRIVPMEVISCGWSRTGTMTTKAAFEILGLPTWHFVEQAANPPDIDLWSEAMLAKLAPQEAARKGIKPADRELFDKLLWRYSATTDQPAAIFCEELLAAYPGLKVVLHERDVDKWHKSYCDAVIDSCFHPFIPLASIIDSFYMKRMTYQADILMRHFFGVTIPRAGWLFNNQGAREMYRQMAKSGYLKHNEMVKRVTPKDRLLLFKVEDEWEPLCKFLGKPIPDVPFPRVNETEAAKEMVQAYILQSYRLFAMKVARRAVVFAAILIAVWWWWWWW